MVLVGETQERDEIPLKTAKEEVYGSDLGELRPSRRRELLRQLPAVDQLREQTRRRRRDVSMRS